MKTKNFLDHQKSDWLLKAEGLKELAMKDCQVLFNDLPILQSVKSFQKTQVCIESGSRKDTCQGKFKNF